MNSVMIVMLVFVGVLAGVLEAIQLLPGHVSLPVNAV